MDRLSDDAGAWYSVKLFIDGLPKKGKSKYLHERFERLMAVRANQLNAARRKTTTLPKIDKAWRKISKSAKTEDAILSIFLGLPDTATSQPFAALAQGERVLSPVDQREKYHEMAKHAKALVDFFASSKSGDPLRQLLSDLDTGADWESRLPQLTSKADGLKTHEYTQAAINLWDVNNGLKVKPTLNFLLAAFTGANPQKHYLTKQPKAKNAAKQSYIVLVAELNSYLKTPQHAALAEIANSNVAGLVIEGDAIRQAWDSKKTVQLFE
jgi:hypothetical protein